ncbi:MAG: sel1 repeat family protein, partial [Candidatus Methanomethylophilus sp.]|nr:sel1 repeat family protein [Methanomethylophilus sp.]
MEDTVIYYSGRNIRNLVRLADRDDDADAMFELGYRYYFGYGVRHNIGKALLWFYNAAIRGDADGCYMMGTMLSCGEGVELDDEEAVYWFLQAADLGHLDSMNELGIMFAEGYGVEKDMAIARE